MKLGEKLRYLREVEGNLRGMDRAMTQQELVQGDPVGTEDLDEPELPVAD